MQTRFCQIATNKVWFSIKKKMDVWLSQIKVKKVNGRFQLIGTSKNGKPLYKFASEATAKKYK